MKLTQSDSWLWQCNIKTILIEIPSKFGPFGAKGVGEPPIVPFGADTSQRRIRCCCARVTQLPITPERLFLTLHSVVDSQNVLLHERSEMHAPLSGGAMGSINQWLHLASFSFYQPS